MDALRLDVTLEASTAYLRVLQAKTVEKIQKDNLKLTRYNLELAQVRDMIGAASPAELYRWEAEIASARNSAIYANSQRNLAEIDLNRILHRPLEESFYPTEFDLSDPKLMLTDTELFNLIDNPRNFSRLRDFFVKFGLEYSPEIKQIDAAIAAQERLTLSNKREFYSPTLAMFGEVSELVSESGKGKGDGGMPLFADDNNWTFGLNLTIPVYKGGSRRAQHAKAKMELSALKKQKEAVADLLEQRIRSSLHIAQASYTAIKLTHDQAEAAHKLLDIVTDAYASGAVSILDLLDAQNAAIHSNLGSANAVYNFYIDFLNTQRSIGNFGIFTSETDKKEFCTKLEQYIKDD